jgi:hypothetical protein
MRCAALLLALSLAAPAAAQNKRFEMDFGPVDLKTAGQQEYKLPALPDADLTFGLKLTAPEGLRHLPKATVRITLLNEKDEVVFDVSDELENWTRAESTKEWFLYQPGSHAQTRKSGRYRATVETVKSDVTMSKFVVRLMGVGGGAK